MVRDSSEDIGGHLWIFDGSSFVQTEEKFSSISWSFVTVSIDYRLTTIDGELKNM